MQPKTEELLHFLLWSADKLARPSFRNLTDSYEAWAYRNGLLRQVAKLEKERWIERDPKSPRDRLYRLTEMGRLHALGGRDPEAQWARAWDGKWRLILFDIPMARHIQRGRLRRYLRARGFGYLQGSVWVTPDPMPSEREALASGEINVESLLLLEARPCAGERDEQIVSGAWDFAAINRRYAKYIKWLHQRPTAPLNNNAAAKALRRWAVEERAAWQAAVEIDPLLPKRLLPEDYLGWRVWQDRTETLRQAGQQLRSFTNSQR